MAADEMVSLPRSAARAPQRGGRHTRRLSAAVLGGAAFLSEPGFLSGQRLRTAPRVAWQCASGRGECSNQTSRLRAECQSETWSGKSLRLDLTAFAGAAIGFGVASRKRGSAIGAHSEAAGPNSQDDTMKVKPDSEPTVATELGKMGYESLGVGAEDMLTPEDRITPVDRLMGTDNYIRTAVDLSGFIDSSDESNYVTVVLPMPMGIEFLLNERGGGAMVGSLEPGYPAFDSGRLFPGFLLILVEGIPVYGKSLEEAMRPIDDRDGTVQLTFFRGDPIYFYGDYRPSQEWLQAFVEKFNSNLDQ